jgi:hypothetical protein
LFLRREFLGMTDYFALLGEARQPWLEPEELKEKYFARARRAPADAELNEAFRVLSDPKLRLRHLLALEGVEANAGREIPPALAELFWNTGTLLREIDRWLLRVAETSSALGRALLSGERAKLKTKLDGLDVQLNTAHEEALGRLRQPNDTVGLIELHDNFSYLTRLREQTREKRLRLDA